MAIKHIDPLTRFVLEFVIIAASVRHSAPTNTFGLPLQCLIVIINYSGVPSFGQWFPIEFGFLRNPQEAYAVNVRNVKKPSRLALRTRTRRDSIRRQIKRATSLLVIDKAARLRDQRMGKRGKRVLQVTICEVNSRS